jgi:hypothetical protein
MRVNPTSTRTSRSLRTSTTPATWDGSPPSGFTDRRAKKSSSRGGRSPGCSGPWETSCRNSAVRSGSVTVGTLLRSVSTAASTSASL